MTSFRYVNPSRIARPAARTCSASGAVGDTPNAWLKARRPSLATTGPPVWRRSRTAQGRGPSGIGSTTASSDGTDGCVLTWERATTAMRSWKLAIVK